METNNHWISVKDRLPAYYKDVLVIARNGGELLYMVAYLTIGGLWLRNAALRIRCIVTHWMPLPEPPKEDEQHE